MNETAHDITIALVDDCEVVARGLRDMLAGYPFRLIWAPADKLVEKLSGKVVGRPIDLLLFDPLAGGAFDSVGMARLRQLPAIGRLVVYTWEQNDWLVATAIRSGADGYVSKRAPGNVIRTAIGRLRDGERVLATGPSVTAPEASPLSVLRSQPTLDEGLTARETEVLTLIAQGMSNHDIARSLYVSINSVKSYIRTAYRKIHAESRSQALLWAVEHGLSSPVRRPVIAAGAA